MLGPEFLIAHGRIYSPQASRALLRRLLGEVSWQSEFVAFGRRFVLPRLQAWFADAGVHYRYSENMLEQQTWLEPLLAIKHKVEAQCGHQFNSVLLTYYRDGHDHVSWHADDERELGEAPVIASLSLGASRDFHYRHKQTQLSDSVPVHDGELLLMQPAFQQEWDHCILPQPELTAPRLNLTFRQVVMRRA